MVIVFFAPVDFFLLISSKIYTFKADITESICNLYNAFFITQKLYYCYSSCYIIRAWKYFIYYLASTNTFLAGQHRKQDQPICITRQAET